MSGSQGYSLEQLLSWSLQDHLIDAYERQGDRLVIVAGGLRHDLPRGEARSYLIGMIRSQGGSRRPMRPRGRAGRPAPEGPQAFPAGCNPAA